MFFWLASRRAQFGLVRVTMVVCVGLFKCLSTLPPTLCTLTFWPAVGPNVWSRSDKLDSSSHWGSPLHGSLTRVDETGAEMGLNDKDPVFPPESPQNILYSFGKIFILTPISSAQ